MQPQVEKTDEKLFEVKTSMYGVFTLLKQNDEVKIAIKNQIVTDHVFKSFDEAEKYINKKPWELILVSTYLYHEHITEQLQIQQKINNSIQN